MYDNRPVSTQVSLYVTNVTKYTYFCREVDSEMIRMTTVLFLLKLALMSPMLLNILIFVGKFDYR